VVPVSEAELLRTAFTAEGLSSTDHMVYTYPLGGHDAVTVLSGFERAKGFLSRLHTPLASSAIP
jgi:hypothetical protein